MNCTKLICTSLLSALVITTGCKEEEEKTGTVEGTTPDVTTAAGANVAVPEVPKDPNEVIASVNGEEYLRKDISATVDSIIKMQNIPPAQAPMIRPRIETQLANQFIMKTLLLAEAEKKGLSVTKEEIEKKTAEINERLKSQNKTIDAYFKESPLGEEQARKDFENGLLFDKLITDEVLAKIEITDDEVAKFIADINTGNIEIEKKNKEIEETNKNLDKINAEKKAKIEDLKKQLENGADFGELAKANSECPSGKRDNGSLGTFTRGQMVPAFDAVAFDQEIGKVSDIVETQFGYHLIKVTAKTAAVEASGDTPASPESVAASHILIKSEQPQQPQSARPVPEADKVKEMLKQQKAQEPVEAYIKGLKKAAKIECIYAELLEPEEEPKPAEPAE